MSDISNYQKPSIPLRTKVRAISNAFRSTGIWHSDRERGARAKNGNGTYLLAVFEVLDGEYRGRKIFQNITLQNDNQQAVEIGQRLLTDIYTAVGHTGPTRDICVMLFKPVMARVGIKRDKDGVYPDRNCITSVRPPDYPAEAGRGAAPPRQLTDPGRRRRPSRQHRRPAVRRCAVAVIVP